MKRRYRITEADLSSESSIHSFFNKLSEEEKKSWKKLLKECIDENPRIKRNVRFYKFLLGFGGVIIIVSILTGIADLLVFPAVAALGTALDKRTFNEIRECVKRKKEMQKNTEEDLPSSEYQPMESIGESKRKKVIRLTELDLIRLVKRVIKEQKEDVPSFLNERGYVLNNNLRSGKLSDTVRRLKEKYQMNDYYYNKINEVQLITNNSKILFIVAPEGIRELGPYDFEDVRQYL